MPSTIQKAIALFKSYQEHSFDGYISIQEIIDDIESLLPEEEKMIIDAWKAAIRFDNLDGNDFHYPDLETYIEDLKK